MDNNTLRKVQLAQLEIAKEIKRVCDENDIKYFLDAGTLLGTVRHFIFFSCHFMQSLNIITIFC